MPTYGVYSEVGKLRKVLVHRPDLSLKRLTPSNFQELLSDVVAAALGLKHLRQVPTGGDEFEAEREQWEDGTNLLALEPSVVVACQVVHS